jgi:hypothetical protein
MKLPEMRILKRFASEALVCSWRSVKRELRTRLLVEVPLTIGNAYTSTTRMNPQRCGLMRVVCREVLFAPRGIGVA